MTRRIAQVYSVTEVIKFSCQLYPDLDMTWYILMYSWLAMLYL
jgi:hypothetical protein